MFLDPTLHTRLSRYLSGDLLAQLPDAAALTAAIRQLNSLHQTVSSFLPSYIAENETILTRDYHDQRPGTFMFADVSGFTALSEKLQRQRGSLGAEALTDVINDYFATMLEILAKSNGQLLKFAGDALLTFFPASGGEDETPLAIRTGLRMQRAMMAKFQPIQTPSLAELLGDHKLELSMSIGIACGKLFEAAVGNDVQRDHLIQGDLPGLAMLAEGAGERDDVIIDAELQAAYANEFDTVPAGDGFYRVLDNFGAQLSDYEFVVPRRRRAAAGALFDFQQENLLEDLHRQLERLDNVARFVAPEIVNKLAFRGDHIESENRPATVIFAHITGFAELLEAWGPDHLPLLTSILSRYYCIVQRSIIANGGSLNRSDPYQKGVKLLITFGAPVAHVDDPERAVTTALEMNRQLALFNDRLRDELPAELHRDPFITQRIGITHGPVFAGEVGWRARREYTVMGDDVNLAARLMGKGQMGEILVSSRIWERVSPHFDTEALPPFQLKGKSQPTQAYLVKASTVSPLSMSATSDTPLVGRDLQLLSLTYALQQAKDPRRRQIMALVGDAGLGKSRMAQAVVEDAQGKGFVAAWANCHQPFWAAIIVQLLQLDEAKSEQARRRLLNVRLNELGLDELESVLSQFLFSTPDDATQPKPPQEKSTGANLFQLAQTANQPTQSGLFAAAQNRLESPLAETGEQKLWQTVHRRTDLPDSILRLIQTFAEQTPTLLMFDDVHQADPKSAAILRHVLDKASKTRLMILVAYEPDKALDLHIRRTVKLAELERAEVDLLAARVLKINEIGYRLSAFVWEFAGGRPLFVESLLRLLQEKGLIEMTRKRAELTADPVPQQLPEDVRELIISRTDCLPPETRTVLQVAAVLGMEFSPAALLAVSGIDPAHLDPLLHDLDQINLIDAQRGGESYRFRHGLTRLALYESLNRIQRQKYHRATAVHWELVGDTDQMIGHLIKGGMPLRAMEQLITLAHQAEEAHDLDQAIQMVTRALEILPNEADLLKELKRLQSEKD